MNEKEVMQDKLLMLREIIPFTLLQGAGEGTQILVISSASNYHWMAQVVVRQTEFSAFLL